MDTYNFRSAGLTCLFAFDTFISDPLYNTLNFPDELKIQATNMEDYTKQFNWIKQAVSSDKLVFAAVGTDGSFDSINKHVYEVGTFDNVLDTIMNNKYYMFIYESAEYPKYLQKYLDKHSRTEIRLIYERSIIHRYVSHYFSLFEKQFKNGDLLSGDKFYMVFPDTTPDSDNFTKVVDVVNVH